MDTKKKNGSREQIHVNLTSLLRTLRQSGESAQGESHLADASYAR